MFFMFKQKIKSIIKEAINEVFNEMINESGWTLTDNGIVDYDKHGLSKNGRFNKTAYYNGLSDSTKNSLLASEFSKGKIYSPAADKIVRGSELPLSRDNGEQEDTQKLYDKDKAKMDNDKKEFLKKQKRDDKSTLRRMRKGFLHREDSLNREL